MAQLYPKDIVMYNQDLKLLMKLPGRIPGEFDKELLNFLKITLTAKKTALVSDTADTKAAL